MSVLYTIGLILLLLVLVFFLFVVFVASYEFPGFKCFFRTFLRDVRAGFWYLKVKAFVKKCRYNNSSLGDLFQSLVKKHPNKVCFIFEDKEWTYQEVEEYSNQVANMFVDAGYKKGDEVSIFMENCVEYVCIWLGLSKIGVIPALINSNLRMDSLAHSMNVVNTKAVIFNAALASAVRDVLPLLKNKAAVDCYCLGKLELSGNSFHVKDWNTTLQDASKNTVDKKKHRIGFNDNLLYIYTSGTTGLPKAAIIRHSRLMWICVGARFLIIRSDDDIFYNPLPLYHTAGGIFFLSGVLIFGGTMVIRKKFSASNFWKDCIKYNATVSQYIGEICRFLLNQPKKPEDTQHKIRLMCGNGLRPQLWREFKERFQIKNIVELYGATEGNANVVNVFGKIGAVGFISRIFSRLYPVQIIKVNPVTGEPIRDKNGLCIRCKPGEPGEMVGKILKNSPVNSFDGYADPEATRKKIIRNCFEKGDAAFLSGDILVMDDDGFLYFMDRTGDTFRWRGENVSSTEVEGIISKVLGLTACVVYGVEVPGVEGRAGMAAIQNTVILDMESLYRDLSHSLPSYAVPIFIRKCGNIESTGTYKLRKVELQKQGYNLDCVEDPLFFLDTKAKTYVRLNEDLYKRIQNKEIRL